MVVGAAPPYPSAGLTPELVYLNPQQGGPFSMTSEQPGGLALNFAGGGNYFAYAADIPVRLQNQISIPKPFTANTVTFSIGVALFNTGGVGPPAPSAVTASASLATITNGVIFAYNNLSLVGYQFNGNVGVYLLQGTAQPPVPIGIDLITPNPTLHVVVGVQLPCPGIGANPSPGASLAFPEITTIQSGGPYDTGIQLLGNPGR
jgi:hypothetical protein